MNRTEIILEFHKIREMLCENAISDAAREILIKWKPFLKEKECRRKMEETTEARKILEMAGSPPLAAMKDIEKVLAACENGSMLLPEQLEYVVVFLGACGRMKRYLKRAEAGACSIALWGDAFDELAHIRMEIEHAIQNQTVLDSASTKLRDTRRKLENTNALVRRKLEELLRGRTNYFSESFISQRNGRFVLPVKKEYKSQINGTVVDISGSGGTYFMEPASVSKLLDEITMLKIEEENEICKILYTLTGLVESAASQMKVNMDNMISLDVIFARGKLSIGLDGKEVPIDTKREIKIVQGRHPLLKKDECVPLDFSIGGKVRGIIITGPNTGGKTVALKTVGLLSMMAQSGLHVPVKEGHFCMHNLILCDIGDGQSITENLSTFSAHITNIIEILKRAGEESLVLLDELGSGTDPAEGMGIAISILEELRKNGCLLLATTHYPEVKEYGVKAEGLLNARMAFDRESLKPVYKLEIGEAGESCALHIAKRLGFPGHMLKRAYKEAYRSGNEEAPNFEIGDEIPTKENVRIPKIEKDVAVSVAVKEQVQYSLGDSVIVAPENKIGLVFRPVAEKGMIGVQVHGEKMDINHKRLTLKASASEMYPADYDFSIVFDTVENRKVRHQMDKKYVPGLEVPVREF